MALPNEPTATGPGDPTTRILERLSAALAGRYAIERELGRGGMALVLLARDLSDGRLVALKVIHPQLASAVGTKRFRREMDLAAKLEHPHIVSVQDQGATGDLLYYVMPYIDGESVWARLRRAGPLPVAEALQITRDIAGALGYAHRRGLLHRDIKPENILLENTEAGTRALVTDFGIAQALNLAGGERLAAAGVAIGTPAYMSPEQARGSRVDRRSDLYSLGCVLYEMLGGEPPYTGPTGPAVLAKQAKAPVPHLRALRPEIPSAVEQAVTRALAKSPADRFRSAEAFAAALAPDVISGAALTSEPIPPILPVRRRLPRHRRWALAVLGGVIVTAAGTALALWHAPATPSARSRAASPDTRRVVVAAFANQTGDSSLDPLGDVVADYLARGLAETKLVEVFDARAEQATDSATHAGGVAAARTLADALGAASVVWGSYSRRGDSLEFQAQLTDATTGNVLATVSPARGSASQPTQGVEALRHRVMAALAERFDPRLAHVGGAALADVNASRSVSYEAYREFLAGDSVPVFAGGICDSACVSTAVAHYRRAYALDSNFTLPVIGIAVIGFGCERIDSIANALRARHDRLPAFDRAHLDWLVAQCHGEWEKALDRAREAMSLAPRSDRVVGWCAYLALVVGRLHEAIAIDEKLDRRTRLRPYWSYLMQSYHQLGQHQRELAVAQEARRVFPGEMQALRWETNALVGLGRLADVNAQVEEMARLPREVSQNSSFVDYLTQIGLDLRAHGYRKESQAVLERGIRWIKARPAAEQRNLQQDLANALYFVERWDEAHRILKQLAAENPDDMGYRADLGAVAAHRGDRREVARIDRWLAARKGPYLNGGHTFHRARLAAILKDRERAVELYRQALAEGFGGTYDGYGTAHTDPDFESLRDYPPFQELTRPKD